MRRDSVPLILMLTAGAVTCIFTFIRDYPIWAKLLSLLIVLLVFFFLGSLLVWVLDTFDFQNAKRKREEEERQKALEEGEVIEKGAEEDGEQKEGKKES